MRISDWSSDVCSSDLGKLQEELPKNNSVFVVHGQDDATKHAVGRYLEKPGVQPVILQEQINRGMSLIEKLEDFAGRAGFAVIIMTPNDIGGHVDRQDEPKQRARQNTDLNVGNFFDNFTRQRSEEQPSER